MSEEKDPPPMKRGETFMVMPTTMQRAPIIPLRWYLCANCRSCGELIPFIEGREPFGGDGSFAFTRVPCPGCQARHDYPASQLVPVQAQPEAPQTDQTPSRPH